MNIWDRDYAERLRSDHALALGVVREAVQNHQAIVALAIAEITGGAALTSGSHDQAFCVGYKLASGVAEVTTILNAVIIAYGESAGGRWRDQVRSIMDALTDPINRDDLPAAMLRTQGLHLKAADKLLEELETVLREHALNSSLGSGELTRDEDLRALLERGQGSWPHPFDSQK